MEDPLGHDSSLVDGDQSEHVSQGESGCEHSYTTAKEVVLTPAETNVVERNEVEDRAIILLMQAKNKRTKSEVPISYEVLRGQTKEEFIASTLHRTREEGLGNFCRKHENKTTITYHCERHGRPRRKDQNSSPSLTRANCCPAYISFCFEFLPMKGLWVGIVRKFVDHNGHDLSDPQQLRVSSIDPELVDYVGKLLTEGRKPMDILVLCWAWSQSKDQFDFRNRRFYPTPEDIKSIRRYRKSKNLEVKRPPKGSMNPVNKSLYYNYLDELVKVGRLKARSPPTPSSEQRKRKLEETEEVCTEESTEESVQFDAAEPVVESTVNEIEVATVDSRQLAKQQLVEIFAWLDSEQYVDGDWSRDVLDRIEALHSTIFCNTFES